MYSLGSFVIRASASLALVAMPCIAQPVAEFATTAGTAAAVQPAEAVSAPLGRLQVLEPAPSLFAGAEAAASALGPWAAPSGTLAELAGALAHEAHPQRVSRRTPEPADAAEAPPRSAPSGGVALLTGLAVIVFVAYRKLSFKA